MADDSILSAASGQKTRQRRATQACDYCHLRSIRCQKTSHGKCQNCTQFDQACTFNRKPRKRGHKTTDLAAETAPATRGRRLPARSASSLNKAQPESWHAPFIASQAVIMDMAELYFEIVYPIFPFFHQPSFIHRVSRAHYTSDRQFFAVTMAVCALVASRIRDGSVTNPRWDVDSLRHPAPEVFYREAQRQLADFGMAAKLDVLRAHAILAITAIQNGSIREMRWHLGIYQSLVAVDGLHDEANWPSGIGFIEREERRRLFWSIYTLDIFTSSVCGGVVRSREAQSNVLYPAEVDDEHINDDHEPWPPIRGTLSSSERPSLEAHSDCWLSGWNFITDLYRVLEHALTKFRSPHKKSRSFLQEIFHDDSTLTEASVRERVVQKYSNLRPCFKETPAMTYDVNKDRVSFQAANISGSVQLLRIMLCVAGDASIQDRCRVASDAVDALASIPIPYSMAISTPLLHHLGGIGVILGSVFEEQLSESDYGQIRSIMLLMAEVLDNIAVIQHASGASDNLRGLVARIDEYMTRQRQDAHARPTQEASGIAATSNTALATGHSTHIDSYEQMPLDMPNDWSFQLPPDILGELSWDFELGPWAS